MRSKALCMWGPDVDSGFQMDSVHLASVDPGCEPMGVNGRTLGEPSADRWKGTFWP